MKLSKILVVVGITAFVSSIALGNIIAPADSSSLVKSGEYTLTCLFEDGERAVPKEKIEYEIDGYWKFTNGGSNSCTLTKKDK